MQERDQALGALTRLAVDELHAARRELAQRHAKIVDQVADVMQGRSAALRDELRDAGRLVRRFDELDALALPAEEHDTNALVRKLAYRAQAEAERVAIERERVGDARDGDRDVMQPPETDQPARGT